MRLIIAGSRSITSFEVVVKSVEEAISKHNWQVTEVVSGAAKGVDRYGEEWAKQADIPVRIFKPDWKRGRGAGFANNKMMAEYADAAVIVRVSDSSGSQQMAETMRRLGKPFYEVVI
jgi:hypothetical protein